MTPASEPSRRLVAAVEAHITATCARPLRLRAATPQGGGCIHQAWLFTGDEAAFFVKTNSLDAAPMFAAEADGLAALAAAGAIRTPQCIGYGETGQEAFLILEKLQPGALGRAGAARLGEQLALMHQATGEDANAGFGWRHDNFIGATPQSNRSRANWAAFFAAERLRPQLARASENGMPRTLRDDGERLAERLAAFFVTRQPAPSLLHGDLWGGNAAQTPDGEPVIFDPAVYRGDREADIAMTELFGGFPDSFYAAYRQVWPLDEGYETRKTLYNLYHVLNHFNLFGPSWLGGATRMIGRLNACLRG